METRTYTPLPEEIAQLPKEEIQARDPVLYEDWQGNGEG